MTSTDGQIIPRETEGDKQLTKGGDMITEFPKSRAKAPNPDDGDFKEPAPSKDHKRSEEGEDEKIVK